MPILNFLTHKDDYPEGNAFRNTAFMIGHCAFWLLNFLNCSYLILFEGFAFGRLQKNYLSKLSLLACFTQTISCLSSIHRYNINDEYGFWGIFGTGAGLLAFTPFNISYLYLLFNRNKYYAKTNFVGIGIAFWFIVGIACFCLTCINWEDAHFDYFRLYIGASTVYHTVAMIIGYRAHNRGDIQIDASIISHSNMNKVFGVCIVVELLSLMIATRGFPVFIYPGTGLTYTVMTIMMVFVGRMDFMQQAQANNNSSGAASDEATPLTA